MKRLLFVCALVALIVTCVTPTVNTTLSNESPRADGLLPPPFPTGGVILADGLLPPPFPTGGVILADGLVPPPFPSGGVVFST